MNEALDRFQILAVQKHGGGDLGTALYIVQITDVNTVKIHPTFKNREDIVESREEKEYLGFSRSLQDLRALPAE